ncbi:MAG: thioredoxin family protein [Epsilonproteobacteria bacterium]|nr:thioredoxin family protein [Campylobacterota bacterium]NPA63890.1 thioredoxin family protein [Campylobacterota bacterium]
MRFLLWIVVVTALFAAGFDWVRDYDQALKLAKEKNRPIMVMISQKDCPTCEYMEDVAFEDDDLIDFVEHNFIPLKLDLKEAKKLGFKAYGTPTFYFLRSDGSKITRALVGGATAKVFLQKLHEIKGMYGR